ncbi:MAG: TlyA family RNA methyltransferase [Lachnospiraceae bacterium]|nr:TlyA family RNA methyltransferase [Lachnospiraceae bacterium]
MEKRLDVLLVEKGLASSRERARELIEKGQVLVMGIPGKKPAQKVEDTVTPEIRGEVLRYVSRGGLKLEKALDCFGIDLQGKICMDIGASTGGFTDCMLQRGAKQVLAVDVGTDQLAMSLRKDPRVTNLEQTNVRHLTRERLTRIQSCEAFEGADLASVDVSFISLTKVLDAVAALLKETGEMVCLIKPQFEAGRGAVGKKGVVKDPTVHKEVIRLVLTYAFGLGLMPHGLTYSPIRGPEGNIEYLLHLKKRQQAGEGREDFSKISENRGNIDINAVVREAHSML